MCNTVCFQHYERWAMMSSF